MIAEAALASFAGIVRDASRPLVNHDDKDWTSVRGLGCQTSHCLWELHERLSFPEEDWSRALDAGAAIITTGVCSRVSAPGQGWRKRKTGRCRAPDIAL